MADLNEMIYFLRYRIDSTKQYSSNALLQVYDTEETSGVFDVALEDLVRWEKVCTDVISKINCVQLRHLLTLKESEK